MFQEILNYVDTLKETSKIVTNVIQGNLWATKYGNKALNDIVFPLYLFYDDLEVGNALGSHAGKQKFGVLYTSIACLPPRIASRLSSIFLTLLVNSQDKKVSAMKIFLKKLYMK